MTAHVFFRDREWSIVQLLVDAILPEDARSCSATDAGVPEYLDELMGLADALSAGRMRLGLAWIDATCRRRFGAGLCECSPAQRNELLRSIAWPVPRGDERYHGVQFFAWFRHHTAVGFWTSEAGTADLIGWNEGATAFAAARSGAVARDALARRTPHADSDGAAARASVDAGSPVDERRVRDEPT